MYYSLAVTPSGAKLLVSYLVTIASIYAQIPIIAVPAQIVSGIETIASLWFVPLARDKIYQARDEAIQEYCQECPKK